MVIWQHCCKVMVDLGIEGGLLLVFTQIKGSPVAVWTCPGEMVIGTTASTPMIRSPQGAGVVSMLTCADSVPVSNVMDGNNLRGGGPCGGEQPASGSRCWPSKPVAGPSTSSASPARKWCAGVEDSRGGQVGDRRGGGRSWSEWCSWGIESGNGGGGTLDRGRSRVLDDLLKAVSLGLLFVLDIFGLHRVDCLFLHVGQPDEI